MTTTLPPERRLLAAVLEDAIRTLNKYAHSTRIRGQRLRREALGWLLSSDQDDVFSYERICEALSIDPARLRRRVLDSMGTPTAGAPTAAAQPKTSDLSRIAS